MSNEVINNIMRWKLFLGAPTNRLSARSVSKIYSFGNTDFLFTPSFDYPARLFLVILLTNSSMQQIVMKNDQKLIWSFLQNETFKALKCREAVTIYLLDRMTGLNQSV